MKTLIALVPALLLAACAGSGPQPMLVSDSVEPDVITLSWPEGTAASRVDQLAQAYCNVESRRADFVDMGEDGGERTRTYRCVEGLMEFP